MSDVIISDDVLAGLRAEASSKGGGGDWVRLQAKGEWVSGVVVDRGMEEAPFGEVETLILKGVRTHDEDYDADREIEFRLASTVLQRELGEQAEDGGAKPGLLIFVECTGERMSKAGRAYLGFKCVKMDPKSADKKGKEAAKAAPKPKRKPEDVLKDDFGGEEAPF
jgi:hypothetical protein